RFRQFLRDEIAGRQQCTVLLATHNAEEAFDLCERVAVLDRGRLVAVGGVQELVGEVRDDRYRFMVREGHAESAERLMRAVNLAATQLPAEHGSSGWAVLEVGVPDGPDGVAEMTARLAHAGVDVAGVERRPITLADLLER